MHKQSGPRERLAQYLEDRRVELGFRWTDVAERAGLSTETLRQIRQTNSDIRPLSRKGLEDALKWSRGSIAAILRGDEPTVAHAGQVDLPSQVGATGAIVPAADVTDAIRRDPSLIDEAKAHLLSQYELLRRLSPAGGTKEQAAEEMPEPPQRPLRAVARKRPPRDKQ